MPPKNPWSNISWSNTIADCDRAFVTQYLVGLNKGKPSVQIHNEMLPEPFIGDLNAKVYLLNGNPGVTPIDLIFSNDATFERLIQNTLSQVHSPVPFMWISPKKTSVITKLRHSGYDWWKDKLSDVLAIKPRPMICNIEYFPYHSVNMPPIKKPLPSDIFVDWHIKDAIKNNKWIIVLRCKAKWLKRIPELKKYPHLLFCCNPRNVCVSENNLCDSKGAKITTKDWNNLINAM